MQDCSAPTWRVLCTYTDIKFLTVPLTVQLQAWHMLCPISAQIRLLTINHVREFCYSFDQAYNPLSKGFFKQKGSYQENYKFLLCRYQQIWNKLSFWIPSLWIKPRVGVPKHLLSRFLLHYWVRYHKTPRQATGFPTDKCVD